MTFIKVPCPTTSTHVCPIGLNNVMRKNAPNQCAWTKFQPPIWLLALSGPIFLFQPLNQLSLYMALSKNKLAKSSPIIKYAPGQSFSLLRGSWLCQDPFFCFSHYRLHYPKNRPDLHSLKKYAPGPSFSLLHGSWLDMLDANLLLSNPLQMIENHLRLVMAV